MAIFNRWEVWGPFAGAFGPCIFVALDKLANGAAFLDSLSDSGGIMRHLASAAFWEEYERLPPEIRALADKNFALLKANPRHPSLQFKKVGRFWSVRVGAHYRALATEADSEMHWHWIGSHAQYDDRTA